MEKEFNVPITNELDQRIWDIFSKFDELGDKHIHTKDLGMVLRALGCVPMEQEIADFIKETESEQYAGEIHLAKFSETLYVLLLESKMKPNTPTQVHAAFKALDKDCKGYLTKDELIEAVTTGDEPLSEEELQRMLNESVDPLTGNIPYEFYLGKLAYRPKQSIYDLALWLSTEKKDTRKSVAQTN